MSLKELQTQKFKSLLANGLVWRQGKEVGESEFECISEDFLKSRFNSKSLHELFSYGSSTEEFFPTTALINFISISSKE